MLTIPGAAVDRLVLPGGAEVPIGDIPEGKFVKMASGSLVGADPPAGGGGGSGTIVLWTADGPQVFSPAGTAGDVNYTDWTTHVIRPIAVGERFEFDYRILYAAGIDCAFQFGLWFPANTVFWYATPSNVKAGPNSPWNGVRNVVVDQTNSGYFEIAGNGGEWPMLGHLIGIVTEVTTAGNIELRYGPYKKGYTSQYVRLKKQTLLKEWPLP